MKKLLITLLLLLTSGYWMYAQEKKDLLQEPSDTLPKRMQQDPSENYTSGVQLPSVIPPSPQSQIFEKYINHNATEFNGLPDITIPLYEIEIKGLKIPITLSYHASGIQYMQYDGEVGAGWSISAGGYRIMRTINGRDDFHYNFYSEDNLRTLQNSGNQYQTDKYLEAISYTASNEPGEVFPSYPYFNHGSSIDGERDLFSYITPSSNGHFIISERDIANKIYKTASIEQKLDKVAFISTSIADITDENGFKYSFGGKSLEVRELAYRSFNTTAWALNSIVSPYGESILFDYKNYVSLGSRIPRVKSAMLSICPAVVHDYSVPNRDLYSTIEGSGITYPNLVELSYSTPYITNIQGVKENIEFKRIEKKKNLNTPSLISEIVITDLSGTIVKKIEFSYDNSPSWADTSSNVEPWHILLNSVVVSAGNTVEKKYSFDYYNPKEGTHTASPDYWNYYKYNTPSPRNQWIFIPAEFGNEKVAYAAYTTGLVDSVWLGNYIGWKYFFDRTADTTFLNSFSLKSITYPTGGSTLYEYESNKYYDEYKDKVINGVGMRVKKITSYPTANSEPLTTIFTYGTHENGWGIPNCVITSDFFIKTTHQLTLLSDVGALGYGNFKEHRYPRTYFSSNVSNLPHEAFTVHYPEVTRYELNSNGLGYNGKTVSTFTIPLKYMYNLYNINADIGSTIKRGEPYMDWIFPGLKPLLASREIFNQQGNLLQKESYTYVRTNLLKYKSINPIKVRSISGDNTPEDKYDGYNNYNFFYAYYHFWQGFYTINECNIYTGTDLPLSKKITLYFDTDSITTSELYEYDSKYRIQKSKQTTSLDEVLEASYTYPVEGTSLANRNMLSIVLQEVTRNNGQVVKWIRNNYPTDSTKLPLPESVDFSLIGEVDLERELSYTYDQTNGNLLQYIGRDSIPVSFFWGYEKQYPIVKVTNAYYSQVEEGLVNISNIQNYKYFDQLTPVFAHLREELPQAQVSGYTYRPLVGIASETDLNGMSTYYEYDDFNRLHRILDNDRNVIKQYNYHYTGEFYDTIAVMNRNEQMGSVAGGGIFHRGKEITAKATPKLGYLFDGWYENGLRIQNAGASYTFAVAGNRTLEARFAEYPLNTIYKYTRNGVTALRSDYPVASDIALRICLGDGSSINVTMLTGSQELGLGSTIDGSIEAIVYPETQADNTYRYAFSGFPPYSISLTSNPWGAGVLSGEGGYFGGELAKVIVQPTGDYDFVGWYEGASLVSDQEAYSFYVYRSHGLTATFTPIPKYSVSVMATPVAGGTLLGGGSYERNSKVTVTAKANLGYRFSGWYEAGSLLTSATDYNFTASNNRSLEARFVECPANTIYKYEEGGQTIVRADHSVASDVVLRIRYADGSTNNITLMSGSQYLYLGISNASIESIVFPEAQADYTYRYSFSNFLPYSVSLTSSPWGAGTLTGDDNFFGGGLATIKAQPNLDYDFAGWYEGNSLVSSAQTYSFYVYRSYGLTAKFTPIPSYNVALVADPSGSGSLAGAGTYRRGVSVSVSAQPTADYDFVGWYEGSTLLSNQQTYSFSVNRNSTLMAKFTPIPKYSVSVVATPAAGGTLLGGGSYKRDSKVTVTAKLNPGYRFSGWYESGSLLTSATDYNFTASNNRSLEARFTTIPTNTIRRYIEYGTYVVSATYNVASDITILLRNSIDGSTMYAVLMKGEKYLYLGYADNSYPTWYIEEITPTGDSSYRYEFSNFY